MAKTPSNAYKRAKSLIKNNNKTIEAYTGKTRDRSFNRRSAEIIAKRSSKKKTNKK